MSPEDVPNATITKFGYPKSLVAEYSHWVVLLRPQQITLASLILACRSPATEFSQIGEAAFESLEAAIGDIESCLRNTFAYDKINYLMLMMVDPHVHFHVLPRYGTTRDFAGLTFADAGWPAAPNLTAVNDITESQRCELRDHLRTHWPR